jgi:hypothetical protein
MNRTAKILFATVAFAAAVGVQAQTDLYPRMAPIESYLSKDESIAHDATVLVLEKSGYQTAVQGTNGFTCLVERAWMSPFDSTEFWNPKMRGPICYNPAAVRTILPYTLNRTRLALTGATRELMRASILASVAKKKLPLPEAGAMSYMLSKDGNLGDNVGHWCPHLMFHVPTATEAAWGANFAGSPIIFNSRQRDVPEPETIFMVAVFKWSDGTPAPHESMQ